MIKCCAHLSDILEGSGKEAATILDADPADKTNSTAIATKFINKAASQRGYSSGRRGNGRHHAGYTQNLTVQTRDG